jgi:hypothetical protein
MTTTIRRATRDDLPALCALALREHAQSRMAGQPVDLPYVQANLLGAVQGLATAVFVSEKAGAVAGMIVGLVQPSLINRYQTAYELLWYAEDGSGLRLLAALRAWARRMRATELVVHNYAGIADPARFNKVMARRGFGVMGTAYVSALES